MVAVFGTISVRE